MSRFDVEKFEVPPDPELICCICRCVLDNPLESPCQHVFCQICIEGWLTYNRSCPNCRRYLRKEELKGVLPLVQNLINKLIVSCDFKLNGCSVKLPLELMDTHIKICDYEFIQCEHEKCEKKFLRKLLKEHGMTCEYRKIVCSKICGLMVPLNDIKQHNCVRALKQLCQDQSKKIKELLHSYDTLKKEFGELQNRLKSMSRSQINPSEDTGSSSSESLASDSSANILDVVDMDNALRGSSSPANTSLDVFEDDDVFDQTQFIENHFSTMINSVPGARHHDSEVENNLWRADTHDDEQPGYDTEHERYETDVEYLGDEESNYVSNGTEDEADLNDVSYSTSEEADLNGAAGNIQGTTVNSSSWDSLNENDYGVNVEDIFENVEPTDDNIYDYSANHVGGGSDASEHTDEVEVQDSFSSAGVHSNNRIRENLTSHCNNQNKFPQITISDDDDDHHHMELHGPELLSVPQPLQPPPPPPSAEYGAAASPRQLCVIRPRLMQIPLTNTQVAYHHSFFFRNRYPPVELQNLNSQKGRHSLENPDSGFGTGEELSTNSSPDNSLGNYRSDSLVKNKVNSKDEVQQNIAVCTNNSKIPIKRRKVQETGGAIAGSRKAQGSGQKFNVRDRALPSTSRQLSVWASQFLRTRELNVARPLDVSPPDFHVHESESRSNSLWQPFLDTSESTDTFSDLTDSDSNDTASKSVAQLLEEYDSEETDESWTFENEHH